MVAPYDTCNDCGMDVYKVGPCKCQRKKELMDELADLKKSVDELGAAMNKMLATVDGARKVIKELEAENAELRQTIKQARDLFGRQFVRGAQ